MTPLRDRPTSDLVVIALTFIVGVILITSAIGVIFLEAFRPQTDISSLSQRIGTLTSSLVGAIIGYLAGRNVHSSMEN